MSCLLQHVSDDSPAIEPSIVRPMAGPRKCEIDMTLTLGQRFHWTPLARTAFERCIFLPCNGLVNAASSKTCRSRTLSRREGPRHSYFFIQVSDQAVQSVGGHREGGFRRGNKTVPWRFACSWNGRPNWSPSTGSPMARSGKTADVAATVTARSRCAPCRSLSRLSTIRTSSRFADTPAIRSTAC